MKALDPLGIDLEKTTLIEASAGTGKTYTIATLFLRLLAKGYALDSILVVTFTEAAAAELKLRIRTRLLDTVKKLEKRGLEDGDDLVRFLRSQDDGQLIRKRLAFALTCFDQAAVMTIHSFCYKVLKEHSFESGSYFDIELIPDRSYFLKQVSCDFFMTHVNNLDPLFLSYLNQEQITPENILVIFSKALSRPDLICLPDQAEFKDSFDDYRQVIEKIQILLIQRSDEIIQLIADHKGLDKRSYTKKNVPSWLKITQDKISKIGSNTLFKMEEKGDALYKFTRTRMDSKIKSGGAPLNHPFFDCCEQLLGFFDQFSINLISLKLKFIAFFRQELEKMKRIRGICFFDDLVNDLAAALDDPKEEAAQAGQSLKSAVRKTYKACLIDEFQDTDPRQYDIFSTLFSRKGTAFFMIGDPKQAIYAFRGGDIFAYLKASQQCDQRFTLEKNYRSAPLLVNGVNQVFLNEKNPFSYKGIEFNAVSTPRAALDRLIENSKSIPPLQICFLKRDDKKTDRQGYITKETANRLIPQIVANDVLDLLQSNIRLADETKFSPKSVTPEDIAVLVRTNSQAELIQKKLSQFHIPSFLSKTGSVFDSIQATELNDILCAVYEPDNTALVRAALCTSVFNFTAQRIVELDTDETLYFQWHDFFNGCKKKWEKNGFISMIMALLHSDQAFLKGNPALDERGLTNFYHLLELVSQACLTLSLSPYFLLKWVSRQLVPSLRDELSDELRLESDKKAIAIVTIHKSKGMEYPVVFLPYLWEGRRTLPKSDILFHDPGKEDCLTLDLGSKLIETARGCFEKEDTAEQRRLLYVAMTRASALCKIYWGGFKSIDSSSLGTLLHPLGCKDDKVMLNDIEHLVSESHHSIRLEIAKKGAHTLFYKEMKKPYQPQAALEMPREILPSWRMSSFSAIVHSAGSSHQLSGIEKPPSQKTPEIILEAFPKGAGSGDFFHAVYENLDFTGNDTDINNQVESQFNRFGFVEQTLAQLAKTSVRHVIETRLDTQSKNGLQAFTLKDIPVSCRLNEMAFTFPVHSLDVSVLIRALKLSDQNFESSGYLHKLSQLNIPAITGYLKGFIDLIIQHKGRYYIVDYKSNYLGCTYDCYSQNDMQKAMADHHYYLQYHVYLIALHRYLSNRIKHYDYNTHFGGVFYLFIRGMHPEFGSRYGVFYDRPSEKLIRTLSDSL